MCTNGTKTIRRSFCLRVRFSWGADQPVISSLRDSNPTSFQTLSLCVCVCVRPSGCGGKKFHVEVFLFFVCEKRFGLIVPYPGLQQAAHWRRGLWHRTHTQLCQSTVIFFSLSLLKNTTRGSNFFSFFFFFWRFPLTEARSAALDFMKIDTQLLVSPRRDASACRDHQVHVQGTLHYSRCPLLPAPCYPAWGWGGRWVSVLSVVLFLKLEQPSGEAVQHPGELPAASGLALSGVLKWSWRQTAGARRSVGGLSLNWFISADHAHQFTHSHCICFCVFFSLAHIHNIHSDSELCI